VGKEFRDLGADQWIPTMAEFGFLDELDQMHGVVGWLFQRAALSGTRHAMQMIGLKPK
jgi:hypothetical protein